MYLYAQDMVTSSSLYYTPKTAAAEIARPGSEWRWMGVCGWVRGCMEGLRPTEAGSRGIDWLC